jgi:hypothetical protein
LAAGRKLFDFEASGATDDRRHDDAGVRNEAATATRASPEQRLDGGGGHVAEPAQLEGRAAERQVDLSLSAAK